MPTNKTEWIKLLAILIVVCSTCCGGTWFFANVTFGNEIKDLKESVSTNANHAVTTIILDTLTTGQAELRAITSKHTEEINKLSSMLSSFNSAMIRVEANQISQSKESQETMLIVTRLATLLESYEIDNGGDN